MRAMQELNIPIDVVSGTSYGALAGGIYCMTASDPDPKKFEARLEEVMTNNFKTSRMLMDLNFPRTAYFTGWFLNSLLQDTFARRRCEDMLVPFACTSTDLMHCESKVHREGPI